MKSDAEIEVYGSSYYVFEGVETEEDAAKDGTRTWTCPASTAWRRYVE